MAQTFLPSTPQTNLGNVFRWGIQQMQTGNIHNTWIIHDTISHSTINANIQLKTTPQINSTREIDGTNPYTGEYE